VLGVGQGVLRRCREAGTVCWESVGRWKRCIKKGQGADTICLGKVLGGGQGALRRGRGQIPFVGKVLRCGKGALRRCQEEESFVGKVLGGGHGALRMSGLGAYTVCWESVGRRTRCTEKESEGWLVRNRSGMLKLFHEAGATG
jgi:hypothetical protein